MKKIVLILGLSIAFGLSADAQVAKILGRWKTIDDKDGSAKSIVLIFKATNGKYYGKIEKLFKDPEKKCAECKGENKDKPVAGLLVINNMEEKGDALTGGTIMDPKDGKVYKCNISFDAKEGSLEVRGSLDKNGWFGRSQTWLKAN